MGLGNQERERGARDAVQHRAARAMQELRRAEAHLTRRRKSKQQSSATDRAAIRFIVERTREGVDVTPKALAAHLAVSSASVSALLVRLEEKRLIVLRPDPADGRRKIIEPLNPGDDPSVTDELTGAIRAVSAQYDEEQQRLIAGYLDQITVAIRDEADQEH